MRNSSFRLPNGFIISSREGLKEGFHPQTGNSTKYFFYSSLFAKMNLLAGPEPRKSGKALVDREPGVYRSFHVFVGGHSLIFHKHEK